MVHPLISQYITILLQSSNHHTEESIVVSVKKKFKKMEEDEETLRKEIISEMNWEKIKKLNNLYITKE